MKGPPTIFSPFLVHEYLTLSASRFTDKTAVVSGQDRLSYGELDRRSASLAASLSRMGVRRHDRVVIFLDNSPEVVVSLYGILKAGAAFVILNGSVKQRKLGYILRDSGASALIAHVAKRDVVEDALAVMECSVPVIWVGGGDRAPTATRGIFHSLPWDEAMRSPVGGDSGPPIIDQDLAALIYTSGSTGEPKGVISTHQNMAAAAWSIIRYLENSPEDVIVNVLPLSFDYGLYQVIMSVMFGGTVVFEPFVFPIKVLQSIQRERVTGFPLVPTMAAFLLKMENLDRYDLSSLRYMTNTGATLFPEHIRRLRLLLPHVMIYSMFGLTECKRVCYLPPEDVDQRPGSVGKSIPNCETFILDVHGREVENGEVGELVIRGANVMRGYWNDPELTASVYRPGLIPGERWLWSGDYFRRDKEGFLYFLGRKDDMIKTKGERVSPREVEYALAEIPGVIEAAVLGVPDDILGQAIIAFVVRSPRSSLNEQSFLKNASGRLESFMIPKRVVFIDDLPRTANGKVDKRALAADVLRAQ
jgi:long-chain acyl-CoA synthetase